MTPSHKWDAISHFNVFHCYYQPKRSFGQGNILTSVCLSTGGYSSMPCRSVLGGYPSMPCRSVLGVSNFSGGVWSLGGGGRGRGSPIFQGVLQFFGGVSPIFWGVSNFSGGLQFLRGAVSNFSEYGQRSAGAHPTGMHSCVFEVEK